MPKRFEKHFKQFCSKHGLLNSNDDIYVSFSGGIDSVVMVDLLCSFGYSNQLVLIHFNHLNRESNAKDENFVKAFTAERKIKLEIIKLYGLKESNFENEARKKRYSKLASIAKGSPILMGHHIDDSFEWSLMQQFKSSSLKSSIGIPLVNGNIIRPLMCMTKSQISYYARLKELKFSSDPTNQNISHERNYVRNILVPKIKSKYPSYLKNYVSRSYKLALSFDLTFLEQRSFICQQKKDFSEIYTLDHKGEFDGLSELIINEVQRLSSKKRGSTRDQVQKIVTALKNNKLGPLVLVDGIKVYISYNHLFISKKCPVLNSELKSFRLNLDQYQNLLLERKTFFGSFVSVKNLKLSTIKRSYPFNSNCIGRIAPLDLVRQWSKPRNINKVLDIVF